MVDLIELTPETARATILSMMLLSLDRTHFHKVCRTTWQKSKFPQHVIQQFEEAYEKLMLELQQMAEFPEKPDSK